VNFAYAADLVFMVPFCNFVTEFLSKDRESAGEQD
jgi:hypothetical protein